MIGVLPSLGHSYQAGMISFGPNSEAVQRMIERARRISNEDAHAVLNARASFVGMRAADDAERSALRRAVVSARRSKRLEPYLAARHAASDAFRQARRGEVGPWLGVSAAIANAAGALVVSDLLELEDFEVLYRPWRSAIHGAELVAVGPGGGAFGTAKRRRPTTLVGG